MTEFVKLEGGRNHGYKVMVGSNAREVQFAFSVSREAVLADLDVQIAIDHFDIERYRRTNKTDEDGLTIFADITLT